MPLEPTFAPTPFAKTCICYISDEGYLFPSLLSAMQMRQNISASNADVVMYYVGSMTPKSALFQSTYESLGIKFVIVSPNLIDNMHIMFARLFVDRFADSNYRQFLYIDGDTQIGAHIDPLINLELPEDRFCAARDPLTLVMSSKNSDPFKQRAYFNGIGLSSERLRNYFNSGVIRFDRESWSTISADALREVRSRKSIFRFPDQDALNIVAGDKCLTMSYKWNYPAFLLNTDLRDQIKPRIFHFMSNPRPWNGAFQPWDRKHHSVYLDLAERHPSLAPYFPTISRLRYVKYYFQQYYKGWTESGIWRDREIFEKVLEIESEAVV
jgi:lipopolysaccharide biosynthesis glycosyltransferase